MPKYQKVFNLFQTHYNYKTNQQIQVLQPHIANWANPVMDNLIIIDNVVREKYNEFYQTYKDNKLQNNSTIRLSPLSNLPAYKLKNYITENKLNIQKVRKTSKVDSLIVSDSLIREIYINAEDYLYYIVPVEFLKSITPSKSKKDKYEADFYLINMDDETKSNLLTNHPAIYNKIIEHESFYGHYLEGGWGSKKTIENYGLFDALINNPNSLAGNIIFDDTINSEINNGLAIDDDLFGNIIDMLKSSDEGNLNLAQEIVANCELTASKPYILFLLWKFEKFKKINNNLNFKYCLNSLKSYRHVYGVSKYDNYNIKLEDFISKLTKLHPEYMQTIFNCLRIYINKESGKTIINEITVS